jgi:hypothetical protein
MNCPIDGAEWFCVVCTATASRSKPNFAASVRRILSASSLVVVMTSSDRKQNFLPPSSRTSARACSGVATFSIGRGTPMWPSIWQPRNGVMSASPAPARRTTSAACSTDCSAARAIAVVAAPIPTPPRKPRRDTALGGVPSATCAAVEESFMACAFRGVMTGEM